MAEQIRRATKIIGSKRSQLEKQHANENLHRQYAQNERIFEIFKCGLIHLHEIKCLYSRLFFAYLLKHYVFQLLSHDLFLHFTSHSNVQMQNADLV